MAARLSGLTARLALAALAPVALLVFLPLDRAPQVRLLTPPRALPSRMLEIRYQASDDRGLDRLILVWGQQGRWQTALLPALPAGRRAVTGRIQQDLTQDMWAGQPVMVHLAARDDAGAMALSAAAQVRLPQRPFSSPVARQLIALRRQLLAGSMEPLTAALALTRMSSRPGPLRDDLTVYLGLRAAIHRLTNGSYRGGPEDAAGMLWQVALDLESQKTATVRRN